MVGMARKKENSAAARRRRPRAARRRWSSRTRDTPGISARHWKKPICSAEQRRQLHRVGYVGFSSSRSTTNRITPPTISMMQISMGVSNSTPLMKSCSERAEHGRGQERDHDADDEAARGRVVGQPDDRRSRAGEIDHDDGRGSRRAGSAPRMPCRSTGSRGNGRRAGDAPVEETGMNSVRPSSRPSSAASINLATVMGISGRERRGESAASSPRGRAAAIARKAHAALGSPALRASRLSQRRTTMQLYHFPFCPHSRFVRLVLGEYGDDRSRRSRSRSGSGGTSFSP